MTKLPKIAVLGGGLAGVSVALELAHCGKEVLLIEQDSEILNRASSRNEGKIHLGLIYANEPSMATAKLQLQGALTFHSLLGRWLGPAVNRIPISTPFTYLVSKTSVLDANDIELHYQKLEQLYQAHLQQFPDTDYLGLRLDRLYQKQASFPDCFDSDEFSCSFDTEERAIDTDHMAKHLRNAVECNALIQVLSSARVEQVTRQGGRLHVEALRDGKMWRGDFEQVVNALWDGRIRIDRTYGIEPRPGWVYRLKYRTIVKLPETLARAPSATIVLGPYGDVVIRPDRTAYLSWYPTGLKGWSHALEPPAEWASACMGEANDEQSLLFAQETIAAISEWYPEMIHAEPVHVDAGVICAFGQTDVDDKSSALHGRSDVGLSSDNGYHSLDPGKLTTAPLLGQLTAQAVLCH